MQNAGKYFRYCPDEEHIKLSDAVCRGRRRSNFPKCRGCQFNDDERRPAPARYEAAYEGATSAAAFNDRAAHLANSAAVLLAVAGAVAADAVSTGDGRGHADGGVGGGGSGESQGGGGAARASARIGGDDVANQNPPAPTPWTAPGGDAAATSDEAVSADEPLDAPAGLDEITADDARGALRSIDAIAQSALPGPGPSVTLSPAERMAEFHRLFRQSDVRGLYPAPLNPAAAWRIGHAAAQLLRSRLKGFQRADPRARSLVVGRDARSASAALHAAMVDGVLATGATVFDLGVIDTPQLYFAARHMGAGAGVMTTGGRWASAYSGFKFCGFAGRDVGWTTGLLDIRDVAARIPIHRTGTTGGRYEVDVAPAYREFILQFLPARISRPLCVAMDGAGGAAGPWLRRVFGQVENLRIVSIGEDAAEPFARQPDPTVSENLAALRKLVRAEKADLGVSFDGDADACAFVDERGAMVRPDVAAALLARGMIEAHGPGLVVYDYRCGQVVREEIERLEAAARAELPESSGIRKVMVEGNAVFGATMAGQYFFRECGMSESAFAAAAVLIGLLASAPRKLSDRVRPLSHGKSSGERRIASDDPSAALERIAGEYQKLAQRLPSGLSVRGDDFGFHLYRRGGDAELSLFAEAPTRERLAEVVRKVQALVGATA